MGIKLVSTTLSLAFFAVSVLNVGAQEPSQVRKAELASTQTRFACDVEFIEFDRHQLAQLGIDFDAQVFETQTSPFSLKNSAKFHGLIASSEKKGLAEKVFAPSMIITSGNVASITAKTDAREFDLHLKPQIKPNGYKADFEFQVTQPDLAHPGATRTRSVAFVCEGKIEETLAMNVTELFSGDSKSKFVIVLLTINQRTNVASLSR